jgi:hypothetical protein
MDQEDRYLHAQQFKDKADLATNHQRDWTKFQEKLKEYSDKYGIGYANILLSKEKEALETRFNLEIQHLAEYHDQQWFGPPENTSNTSPYILPFYLRSHQVSKDQIVQDVQQAEIEPSRPLFKNPAKELNEEPKQASQKQTNDPSKPQDLSKSATTFQKAKETINEITGNKSLTISQRFTQGLSYTRAAENTKENPKKDMNFDRE